MTNLSIGQIISLKSMQGREWNSWTIIRQDARGEFHAEHDMEFSTYQVQVKPDDILEFTGTHHNVPFLIERNHRWLAR